MEKSIRIGIIGDFDSDRISHVATNDALEHCTNILAIDLETTWVSTSSVDTPRKLEILKNFSGIWFGPGDIDNVNGALSSVQYCRENGIPFLGTCSGFQFSLLEYAVNVVNIEGATHEEIDPDSDTALISRLSSSLAGKSETLDLVSGSKIQKIYGKQKTEEKYRCNYGLNEKYTDTLCKGGLKYTAFDEKKSVRGFELDNHRFFISTLFLPQLSSSKKKPNPLVMAFTKSALDFG